MNYFLPIGKHSISMDDRFAHQATARLQTCIRGAVLIQF
jgi:hypothetical protein